MTSPADESAERGEPGQPVELIEQVGRGAPVEPVADALLSRPRLSLRAQVLFVFLLVFLFAALIAAAIVVSIYRVEEKVQLLEVVNDYVLQIDEARRFEKNYFLYRTDLDDALEASLKAKRILVGSKQELQRSVGHRQWKRIFDNLNAYAAELEQLTQQSAETRRSATDRQRRAIERRVRGRGHAMILAAQDLMKRERRSIEAAITGSRRIQVYSLIFLLIFMISTAYLMSRNIVRRIIRFQAYTQQIAAGDFSPITPARRYRDEFSDLAVAVNQMMQDLQTHEALLVQAHKMRAIGTLTAGVAHELNNPLNNITITVHMLLEDFDQLEDGECQEMIRDVTNEVARAKEIVANLLDFTRESKTRLEPLDLGELVSTTLDLAANQIKLGGIQARIQVADQLPQIQGDSQQLRQVFLNLILNAVAASRRGGEISLVIGPGEEAGVLSVKVIDRGTGIPAHILERIFDPFFTTKPSGKGTGLGLSVSQGIVAKHGGRISVESREGSGSVFTVLLPATTI